MRVLRFLAGIMVAFGGMTAAGAAVSTPSGHTVTANAVPTLPLVVPGMVTQNEGSSGPTTLTIPVTLSHASTDAVTVDYQTRYCFGCPGHQAIPVFDYIPRHGTVTFAPGQTAKSVTIIVWGDHIPERNDYFIVQFGNPTNAGMGGFWGLGFGQLLNDDHFCFLF